MTCLSSHFLLTSKSLWVHRPSNPSLEWCPLSLPHSLIWGTSPYTVLKLYPLRALGKDRGLPALSSTRSRLWASRRMWQPAGWAGPLGCYLKPQERPQINHSCLWQLCLYPLLTLEMEGMTKRRQDNCIPALALL